MALTRPSTGYEGGGDMAWRWWPLGSLRLRRHTTVGVPRKRSGPSPPRARGRSLVILRAGSQRGARRQQADRRRGLPTGMEEQAMARRPPVGEQRGPSSRLRTHCRMEKRPTWGARSSRGRMVGLSSPLSSRLLQPRHWCSLGRCMGGGREFGPRHEFDPRV
ncbi:hypothetical protein VPH35_128418 [Triticum aestivum]